jgi:hypothetical protein
MPEVVGADDEQATEKMHAKRIGRERVRARLITTSLLLDTEKICWFVRPKSRLSSLNVSVRVPYNTAAEKWRVGGSDVRLTVLRGTT